MARYDLEMLLDDVSKVIKDNLNTKLTEIDTRKNDGITLAQVDAAAYCTEGLSGGGLNFNPFVMVSIAELEEIGTIGAVAERPTVSAMIVVADNGNDPVLWRKMHRYMLALKELFEHNFSKNRLGLKFEITRLLPVQVKRESRVYQVTGVSLTATLA
jgi:hypothetical protein